jgi:hypothetical protein
MKTVAEVIGVSRSNLVERLQERPPRWIGRPPLPDEELVAQIKAVPMPAPETPDAVSKGSGFWLSEEELVATCWHVVARNPTASILVLSAIDSVFDLEHGNVTNGRKTNG